MSYGEICNSTKGGYVCREYKGHDGDCRAYSANGVLVSMWPTPISSPENLDLFEGKCLDVETDTIKNKSQQQSDSRRVNHG